MFKQILLILLSVIICSCTRTVEVDPIFNTSSKPLISAILSDKSSETFTWDQHRRIKRWQLEDESSSTIARFYYISIDSIIIETVWKDRTFIPTFINYLDTLTMKNGLVTEIRGRYVLNTETPKYYAANLSYSRQTLSLAMLSYKYKRSYLTPFAEGNSIIHYKQTDNTLQCYGNNAFAILTNQDFNTFYFVNSTTNYQPQSCHYRFLESSPLLPQYKALYLMGLFGQRPEALIEYTLSKSDYSSYISRTDYSYLFDNGVPVKYSITHKSEDQTTQTVYNLVWE